MTRFSPGLDPRSCPLTSWTWTYNTGPGPPISGPGPGHLGSGPGPDFGQSTTNCRAEDLRTYCSVCPKYWQSLR